MFAPQSGPCRHNFRRERVVPENVRSFTTPPHQIEATRSVFEGREATDPSVRIREHEFRGDSFFRRSLGKENKEIVKRGSRARATTLLKAYTRKQKIIARSSAEAELYAAAALVASEANGVESMMLDLGFAVKPVLTIDAKATEHILRRHGKRNTLPWLLDGVNPNSLKVRSVKSEDNLADIGTKALSNNIIGKRAVSMGYVDARENLSQAG